ncbi:MAG: dihydrolipoamide acetyltransferase family protein, partial [Bacteroidota bacterium]
PIDGVIAVIGDEGEDWKAALEGASNGNGAAPTTEEEEKTPEPEETSKDDAAVASGSPSAAAAATDNGTDDRVKASPLARAMAKEAGLDLASITGTGTGGRIVKDDVEKAKSAPAAQASPAPATAPAAALSADSTTSPAAASPSPAASVPAFAFNAGGDNFTEEPISQMRKAVSRLVSNSKFSAPHFYVTVEINMGKTWEFRKKINEVAPVKISFNDLVIKACAVNLPKHPVVNSSWQGESIRTNNDVNIAVAVAVPDGLFMPVVRYANMKSLSQINTEVKDLVTRAKARKLGQEEMTGSTFSISNLGMFGVEEFTAILNTPNSCILAVGGIQEKPIVENGEIVPGRVMKVTLSCDHRTVDGASAAAFLNDVKAALENPVRLMV